MQKQWAGFVLSLPWIMVAGKTVLCEPYGTSGCSPRVHGVNLGEFWLVPCMLHGVSVRTRGASTLDSSSACPGVHKASRRHTINGKGQGSCTWKNSQLLSARISLAPGGAMCRGWETEAVEASPAAFGLADQTVYCIHVSVKHCLWWGLPVKEDVS